MSRRRWFTLVALVLLCLAFGSGYALNVVTPEVGEAFVSPWNDAPKLWTFGFVGDTQLGEELTPVIFRQMREAGVEFVLHLGDMVDEATNDAEWDQLMAAAAAEQIRLMPVVGNHDRLGDRFDTGEARFAQYFPHLHGTFYHFRHRGLNFWMLNSERSLAPGSEQDRFLSWQREHHPGPTVVCLHKPVFTCGRRDPVGVLQRRLWLHGAVRKSQVVAVLAGHNHYYDRTRPLDGVTYVVSGGGSPKLYGPERPDATTAKFVSGRNHFGLVDVYADHLTVRAVDLEGHEFDRFDVALHDVEASTHTALVRPGIELPPLAELPEYGRPALEARRQTPGRSPALPRPW